LAARTLSMYPAKFPGPSIAKSDSIEIKRHFGTALSSAGTVTWTMCLDCRSTVLRGMNLPSA